MCVTRERVQKWPIYNDVWVMKPYMKDWKLWEWTIQFNSIDLIVRPNDKDHVIPNSTCKSPSGCFSSLLKEENSNRLSGWQLI